MYAKQHYQKNKEKRKLQQNEAKNKGVELLAIQINRTKDGKGYFINEMNVEF